MFACSIIVMHTMHPNRNENVIGTALEEKVLGTPANVDLDALEVIMVENA